MAELIHEHLREAVTVVDHVEDHGNDSQEEDIESAQEIEREKPLLPAGALLFLARLRRNLKTLCESGRNRSSGRTIVVLGYGLDEIHDFTSSWVLVQYPWCPA